MELCYLHSFGFCAFLSSSSLRCRSSPAPSAESSLENPRAGLAIPSLQQPSLMPPPPQENKLSLRWSRPPLPRPLGAASASASAPSSAAASRVPQKTLAGGSRSPRFGLERMWNNRVRLSLLKPCPSPSQPRTTWTLISLHHQFHWGGPEWVPFKCTREVIQLDLTVNSHRSQRKDRVFVKIPLTPY